MNIKNHGEKIFNAFQEAEIVKINKVTFKNKKITSFSPEDVFRSGTFKITEIYFTNGEDEVKIFEKQMVGSGLKIYFEYEIDYPYFYSKYNTLQKDFSKHPNDLLYKKIYDYYFEIEKPSEEVLEIENDKGFYIQLKENIGENELKKVEQNSVKDFENIKKELKLFEEEFGKSEKEKILKELEKENYIYFKFSNKIKGGKLFLSAISKQPDTKILKFFKRDEIKKYFKNEEQFLKEYNKRLEDDFFENYAELIRKDYF
jgi:hypothetical protein